MVEIKDNFLPLEQFNSLKITIYDKLFPWFWDDNVTGPNGEHSSFYLTHVLFTEMGINSNYFDSIVTPFLNIIDCKQLMRVKVNAYPIAEKRIEHGFHIDKPFEHKGALFSLNTCDGYTRFETGEKIDSVENRMIFFNPNIPHTSTNTTNQKRRVNINFNYF